ncbi:hypothetical protein BC938DRAFT_482844, partial [Jimgerdemannia flammicorona]
MENLYRKAHRLQREVLQNPHLTHIELLSKLEPYVAKSYGKVLDQGLTLKGRFCSVTKSLYQRRNTRDAISSINTKEILNILEIDAYALIADHERRKLLCTGPHEALDRFQDLRQNIKAENEALIRRLEGGWVLDKKWDMTIHTPEEEKNILNVLFDDKTPHTSLEFVNSRYLTKEHFNTLAFQGRKHHITSVDLRGAQAFNNSGFKALHNACGDFLEYLNLSCCPQLTFVGHVENPPWIKSLTSLDVTSSQVFPAYFPSLKRLVMKECANRQEIQLQTPLLERLDLPNCPVLQCLQLDNTKLMEVILTHNSNLKTLDIALLFTQPFLRQIDLQG